MSPLGRAIEDDRLAESLGTLVGGDLVVAPDGSFSVMLGPDVSGQTRGGLPDQWSSRGRFRLRPGRAVVISVEAGVASYFGIQLGDDWFTALDYLDHQTSLNEDQSTVGPDGRLHYVISTTDPGAPNWLDPMGLSEVHVMARWQGLPPDEPPPAAEVCFRRIDQLDEVIGEPIGPADRATQVTMRRESWFARETAAWT